MSQDGVVVPGAAGEVAKRGPKTPAGKLAVSRNASKHGILSPKPVVAHFESEDGWETHRQSILDSLDPQEGIEQALAERVALNSWRLKRVIFYETEQISKLQEEALEDATQLSSLSYGGKDAASLFKDVEEKRGILADIERLLKGALRTYPRLPPQNSSTPRHPSTWPYTGPCRTFRPSGGM